MALRDLNIVDRDIFFGAHNAHRPSTVFNWKWDGNIPSDGITIFLDNSIKDVVRCNATPKVAWLVEPPVIHPHAYQDIIQYYSYFDRVYTFVLGLLGTDPRFRYCPWGTTFIPEKDYQEVSDKSKLLSMVASAKNHAPGHLLRHQVVKMVSGMDLYGRGFNPIDNKADGLKEYMFFIAIENSILDTYYTEKLIDCFLCRTVPLYWGTRSVSGIFNSDGILFFNSVDELMNIIRGLSAEHYSALLPAIEENYRKSLEITNPDLNLWNAGLSEFY